jgi:multidrug efflux pump subunit AcrA (membrane-fusion protein)
VFFSAAERVHVAKAGAQAERDALRGVKVRAQAALTRAEAELVKARADANKARGQKQCGPDCRTKLAAEAAAQADVEAAKRELLSTESKATPDSPLQAPVWLPPTALDIVAFMAIWTGFSKGPVKGRRAEPKRRRRRCVQRRSKPTARRSAANDNIVPFIAA